VPNNLCTRAPETRAPPLAMLLFCSGYLRRFVVNFVRVKYLHYVESHRYSHEFDSMK